MTGKGYKKLVNKLIDSDFKEIVTTKTMDNEKITELEDYKEIWQKSANLKHSYSIDTEADWHKVRQRMNFYSGRQKLQAGKFFLRIAAIAILAIGLTVGLRQILVFYQENQNDFISFATTNETKEIILPDGSIVTLNNNSTLNYNKAFNTGNRDVILAGEAHFNVAKNNQIPFKVFTGLSTVEVVGTIFNIKQTDTTVKVDVKEGIVKLSYTEDNDIAVKLAQNESAVLKENQKQIEKIVIDLTALQWLPERLNYISTPINDVLKTIAQRHELYFTALPEFDTISYTGNLSNKQLTEIITLINLSLSNNEKQLTISDNEILLKSLN